MTAPLRPVVRTIAPVTLTRPNRLANMYVLSPYVWRCDDRYHLMLRCVPRRDDEPRLKMAEIWYGTSIDGLHFDMDEAPAIFPGPDLFDLDGCEDPTVVTTGDQVYLWYTGYNDRERVGRLLMARGPDARHLAKAGVAIESIPPQFANPKEASVVPAAAGWRMFFEFARGGASLIGYADAASLDGPWSPSRDAPIAPRADSWDSWHLSPGPVIETADGRRVMIYNGGDQTAHWRIGWAEFDAEMTNILGRSEAPLLTPAGSRIGSDTDIAFAASAVTQDDDVAIYYSESDQHLRRAIVSFSA